MCLDSSAGLEGSVNLMLSLFSVSALLYYSLRPLAAFYCHDSNEMLVLEGVSQCMWKNCHFYFIAKILMQKSEARACKL